MRNIVLFYFLCIFNYCTSQNGFYGLAHLGYFSKPKGFEGEVNGFFEARKIGIGLGYKTTFLPKFIDKLATEIRYSEFTIHLLSKDIYFYPEAYASQDLSINNAALECKIMPVKKLGKKMEIYAGLQFQLYSPARAVFRSHFGGVVDSSIYETVHLQQIVRYSRGGVYFNTGFCAGLQYGYTDRISFRLECENYFKKYPTISEVLLFTAYKVYRKNEAETESMQFSQSYVIPLRFVEFQFLYRLHWGQKKRSHWRHRCS